VGGGAMKESKDGMTVMDRILCAFGFHAKFEPTGVNVVETGTFGGQRVIARIVACQKCGRTQKEWAW
jgi:hypothetical protein